MAARDDDDDRLPKTEDLVMPMRHPTPEQLSALSPYERGCYALADLCVRHLERPSQRWNSAFMGLVIWACASRRLDIRGLEHVEGLGPSDRILLVANHRSFFDFFVICAILFWKTRAPRRIFFPVRSTFFYDHPLGPLVNSLMSGMRMFPPIMRDREKASFNRYSVERCIEELRRPGTMMGLHPEGTRNKGADPHSFLPAQPGVGKIAIEAKEARVVPVFILGPSSDLAAELRINWTDAARHPVEVAFGPPVDLADLRAQPSRVANHKRAADRCLAAVARLAAEHRARRGGASSEPASRDTTP